MQPDHPSCIPWPGPCAEFTGRISGVGARQLGPGEVSRVVRGLANPGQAHFSASSLAGQPTTKGLGAQGRWFLCVPRPGCLHAKDGVCGSAAALHLRFSSEKEYSPQASARLQQDLRGRPGHFKGWGRML